LGTVLGTAQIALGAPELASPKIFSVLEFIRAFA